MSKLSLFDESYDSLVSTYSADVSLGLVFTNPRYSLSSFSLLHLYTGTLFRLLVMFLHVASPSLLASIDSLLSPLLLTYLGAQCPHLDGIFLALSLRDV